MKQPESVCKKIIDECTLLGFTESISEGQLKNVILATRKVIEDRTLNNWVRALQVLGFIEEKSPHVYKIKNRTA